MDIPITIVVPISDLDIEGRVLQNSISSEYWGAEQTDTWLETEIDSIEYKGNPVEVDTNTYRHIEKYFTKNHLKTPG
jgi:hypothetical protein